MSRTSTWTWKQLRTKAKTQAQAQGQWACPICQTPIDWEYPGRPNSPEVDHIIPHSQGGPDNINNVRVICRTCNRKLGGKNGHQKTRPKPDRITPTTTIQW
jgi:5-methylcytosine-specific restriction endonuclease McrA